MGEVKRYGIDTLCGGCGQRGGGWTPVEMTDGPFVYVSDYAELLRRLAEAEQERDGLFNLTAYIKAQQEWSLRVFGEGPRTLGLLEHIESESNEIRMDPLDLREWVDVVILALDGAWRAGWTAEQIIEAMAKKQAINFARKWPEPGPQDRANFHVGHQALAPTPAGEAQP